jgi:hypothetical protein
MFFPNYNQHVDEFHMIDAADETLLKTKELNSVA